MSDSLHRLMKVGLIHFMAYPQVGGGEGPILETLREILADDYFDAVEVTHMKDPAVRKQARAMLDTAGVTTAYGAQPRLLSAGLNINNLDAEGRKKAVSILKESVDEAYELGAVGLAFLSGKYEESTREDSFRALVDSTLELCEYAANKGGLKIVHEIFDYDIDKKSLIGPASLARRYAEEVCKHFGNFGLMVDLSHLPLIRESAREAILPVKEYLVHAHIGNCVMDPSLPGYGDMHPRFGCRGGCNGVAETVEYLQVLRDVGFLNKESRPIVSFEVKPMGDEDPDLVVANAKRVLNAAWALAGEGTGARGQV